MFHACRREELVWGLVRQPPLLAAWGMAAGRFPRSALRNIISISGRRSGSNSRRL